MKTKEELKKQLIEQRDKINKQLIEWEEQEEYLLSPFTSHFDMNIYLNINKKQILYFDDECDYFGTFCKNNKNNYPLYIKKKGIKHKDIEIGKFYVVVGRNKNLENNIDNLSLYLLILPKDEYVYSNEKNTNVSKYVKWDSYHEVLLGKK